MQRFRTVNCASHSEISDSDDPDDETGSNEGISFFDLRSKKRRSSDRRFPVSVRLSAIPNFELRTGGRRGLVVSTQCRSQCHSQCTTDDQGGNQNIVETALLSSYHRFVDDNGHTCGC